MGGFALTRYALSSTTTREAPFGFRKRRTHWVGHHNHLSTCAIHPLPHPSAGSKLTPPPQCLSDAIAMIGRQL